ncbi:MULTISPECIES: Asp-tRNA(Asn)/Glu-tRNA(Gln) amidotransferase subunit GatB [unclassified Leptotrichia]|uniref:Asp-tRNA(Asn)/Glu-tRNA(Gln) amidotransferase subunit GatB n=1 Tax=unclassified Leptotrichia TaxID=2633022 RepID=UPI0003AE2D9C|nr:MULTISPECIES: Asp-tRNA(Asn)/Glu-tRNA(Gln) amidotransferase subunit GatB [unclassified Leptotrichia]ERL27191.1 aspartyl/glutamyl-tRNA(Asn/Gln) amidotransferase, B subunit [Leptotrichia sp. oral taxon 225 str. F0581]WLD74228.1 Asp-tRNA(Asn)/Glu-tRNA(Gln) amidotransferase subunit GatB [Leptotrichia sp. HMT-225]
MSMEYETVIGLEVHCQLKTNTKVWCSCDADYDNKEPNTAVCPICTGQPGALPKLNEKVLDYAIKAALALGCEINRESYFDRKNYFYPDSPKNYQITQFFKPYAENGALKITTNSGKEASVGIERIQIEEDTAKSIHTASETLLNYNRASVPLIEIISKPEIKNAEEAYAYLNTLKDRLKYTKVSDVSMELGSLRCDANVSVRKKGETKLGTRTETKNLNSFKAVVKAIEYETNRQIEVLENGGRVVQETRLWDEENAVTKPMRSKEEAMDYRYFPEPDLPAIIITESRLSNVKGEMPEFADEKAKRFINEYKLNEMEAATLSSEQELAEYYEEVVKVSDDARLAANWVLTEILRVLKEKNISIEEFSVEPENIGKLIKLIKANTISSKIAKDVFEILLSENKDPEIIVKEKGLVQITDNSKIEKIVEQVLAENPQSVEDYKAGKSNALKYLVGQSMRLSKGKANPQMINEMILARLEG